MAKRLILCSLKELYELFKTKNPNLKIGLSKFASLRPKWCISVGPKGTHSVCVCTIHQNLKLMLDAISIDKSYHELTDMIVCNRESKVCMIHRCASCPGIESVEAYLKRELQRVDPGKMPLSDEIGAVNYCDESETSTDDEDNDLDEISIEFNQWTTTDRSMLTFQTVSASEFISILCEKLDKVTAHSYIARSQAAYLNAKKESLCAEEVIVLGDFSENYKFVIQDEVQGYHWNQQQCTLHPIVLYHKFEDAAQFSVQCLCFISNHLDHDVNFVYKVIFETVAQIKQLSSQVKKISYFSDGCAGQYKNCKNFINLCHHQEDFSIECEWNFFATSHGKSPCDGIGGTVKKLVAMASLQRPSNDQILSAEAMFLYCQEKISGIEFKYIPIEEIQSTRENIRERLSQAKTVPGTRSFHQFIPISSSIIGAKRVSEEVDFALQFSFREEQLEGVEARVGQFVVCNYDELYWAGMLIEVDNDMHDVNVKFMHPSLPSTSLNWPKRDDTCWVPKTKILFKIEPPTLSTHTGRQYILDGKDRDRIDRCLQRM